MQEGSGESIESKSMRSHHGMRTTMNILSERFYWRTIEADVFNYIKSCTQCQLLNPKLGSETPALHSVPVPKAVMTQIGIDISCLPEADGYRYMVLAIDYFRKWSEAKALKDKSASSLALFLYEFICRHGCVDIQINDQGRDFVNAVSEEVHRLTGTRQRITSAYHPQVGDLD